MCLFFGRGSSLEAIYLTVLDEIEIFKGEENSLVMEQAYTHEFQCVYQLDKYPFDTQVRLSYI